MRSAVPLDGRTIIVPIVDIVFTFDTQLLPGAQFEALLRKHRPTDDGFDYNPETFPPALIAASVTGWTVTEDGDVVEAEQRPPTVDECVELWEQWPEGARKYLLRQLELQNVNVVGHQLGKARGRANAPNAPTVPATG